MNKQNREYQGDKRDQRDQREVAINRNVRVITLVSMVPIVPIVSKKMIHIIIYINDIVGKCNRLDKCGYHYTPHQYFTDNPWKRDNSPGEGGSLRPWKRDTPRKKECSFIHFYRENERMNSTPPPPPESKRQCAGLPRMRWPRRAEPSSQ